MLYSSRARLTVLALPLAALAVGAQSVSPSVDGPMVARIREEGLQRSRVMETVACIADVLGARLTLSNDMKRAHAAMADTKVPRKPLRPQGGAR
jgi:hypothetical protein